MTAAATIEEIFLFKVVSFIRRVSFPRSENNNFLDESWKIVSFQKQQSNVAGIGCFKILEVWIFCYALFKCRSLVLACLKAAVTCRRLYENAYGGIWLLCGSAVVHQQGDIVHVVNLTKGSLE